MFLVQRVVPVRRQLIAKLHVQAGWILPRVVLIIQRLVARRRLRHLLLLVLARMQVAQRSRGRVRLVLHVRRERRSRVRRGVRVEGRVVLLLGLQQRNALKIREVPVKWLRLARGRHLGNLTVLRGKRAVRRRSIHQLLRDVLRQIPALSHVGDLVMIQVRETWTSRRFARCAIFSCS